MISSISDYNSGKTDVEYPFPSKEHKKSDLVLNINGSFLKQLTGSFDARVSTCVQILCKMFGSAAPGYVTALSKVMSLRGVDLTKDSASITNSINSLLDKNIKNDVVLPLLKDITHEFSEELKRTNTCSNLPIKLNPFELYKEQKPGGSIKFEIVPSENLMLNTVGIPQFHIDATEYNDIRIMKIRPKIIGVTTESNQVLVKIRAGRKSTIQDKDRRSYTFSYPIVREGSFVHETNGSYNSINDDFGSGSDGVLVDEHHDKIGIFTEWTLWLPEAKAGDGNNPINKNLDYTNVTNIEIHQYMLS